MHTISLPIKGIAGPTQYYLGFTAVDYYANANEEGGTWWGKGAEALRIRGRVDRKTFEALLDGFLPDTALLKIEMRPKAMVKENYN